MKAPKEKAVKALPTFQLSITKKTKRREDKKTAEKGGEVKDDDKMDLEKEPEVDGEKKETEKEKEPPKPEPLFELLNNPARVTPTQLQFISYDVDPRYVPIVQDSGIVLLKDTKPQEKEELLEINKATDLAAGTDNEPEAPEPFEFLG